MKSKQTTLILVALATVVSVVAIAGTRTSLSSPEPMGKITPWAAIKSAQHKVPGKAFSANFAFDDGKWGYDVIIIHDGKADEVEVDAMTGKAGDVEAADPAGEAKELQTDLSNAIAGKSETAAGG